MRTNLDRAKFNLVNNPEGFMPVAFLDTRKGIIVMGLPGLDKYTAHEAICMLAYEHKATSIGTIQDSWYLSTKDIDMEFDPGKDSYLGYPEKSQMEEHIREYDGLSPSQHPDGKDALLMWGAFGNEQFMEMVPYHINDHGLVVFDKLDPTVDTRKADGLSIKNFLWDDTYETMMNEINKSQHREYKE